MTSSIEIIRIRSSHRYKRLQKIMHQQAIDNLEPCWICRQDIDYDAEPRTPDSWSMDHVIAMNIDITLAYTLENLASAHFKCNSSKGDDPAWTTTEAAITETTSIDW